MAERPQNTSGDEPGLSGIPPTNEPSLGTTESVAHAIRSLMAHIRPQQHSEILNALQLNKGIFIIAAQKDDGEISNIINQILEPIQNSPPTIGELERTSIILMNLGQKVPDSNKIEIIDSLDKCSSTLIDIKTQESCQKALENFKRIYTVSSSSQDLEIYSKGLNVLGSLAFSEQILPRGVAVFARFLISSYENRQFKDKNLSKIVFRHGVSLLEKYRLDSEYLSDIQQNSLLDLLDTEQWYVDLVEMVSKLADRFNSQQLIEKLSRIFDKSIFQISPDNPQNLNEQCLNHIPESILLALGDYFYNRGWDTKLSKQISKSLQQRNMFLVQYITGRRDDRYINGLADQD